jgi:hypothetical protein
MRRCLFLLLAVVTLAAPALAEGAKPKVLPGTSVEMPLLMAPISDKDGKLLGYAYITSKLICASPSAAIVVRQKLPFIQDADVRDVNARPIAEAGDPKAADREVLNARLTLNAKRVAGDAMVVRTDFLLIQFAPLHPSESTGKEAETGGGPDAASGTAAAAGAAASTQGPDSKAEPAATSQPAPSPTH